MRLEHFFAPAFEGAFSGIAPDGSRGIYHVASVGMTTLRRDGFASMDDNGTLNPFGSGSASPALACTLSGSARPSLAQAAAILPLAAPATPVTSIPKEPFHEDFPAACPR